MADTLFMKSLGVAQKLLQARDDVNRLPYRSYFFKTYSAGSDVACAALSVIFAPLFNAYLSFIFLNFFVCSSIKSLFCLCCKDFAEAKKSIREAKDEFLEGLNLLFFAIISPVLNFVDFFGRGIATLLNKPLDVDVETLEPQLRQHML